jgi:predicted  nucleic acid-binding Zn-ribbon protein
MTDATDNLKATLQHELDRLAEVRDELKVQLKLAQAEASEEWNKLEDKWLSVQDEMKRVADQSREPLREIGQAAHKLMSELEHGYDRIRSQLKASH